MAISETTLKDAMLILIEEQNKKGGVLGKKLEAVAAFWRHDTKVMDLSEAFITQRQLPLI